jgi:gliding motility-associated-like protein
LKKKFSHERSGKTPTLSYFYFKRSSEMKKQFLQIAFFTSLLFPFANIQAQTNLVYNGDFEIYDTCPEHISFPWDPELQHCLGWSFANWGTSDYYNTCAPLSTYVNVPCNFFGYQQPYSGNAYTGIYSYTQNDTYREYIQSELSRCLLAGAEYYVEFYVSLADHSLYGTNRIGALFTSYRPYWDGWDYIPALPQVANPPDRLISDTVNWYKISGSFFAQGGECYITIGNFFDWTETDTTEPGLYIESTYYYVDNVSVYQKDSLYNWLYLPTIFSPNHDGCNDMFYVRSPDIQEMDLLIFDRWGEVVFHTGDINEGWDGTYKGRDCDPAVYAYMVKALFLNGNEVIKKGTFTLLR